RTPGFAVRLVVVADDAIYFRQASEQRRLRLRGAAGDDDARRRPFALEPADRLARLRHPLAGDGAGVDNDSIGQPRAFRLAPDDVGLAGVEATAESNDIDGHDVTPRRRTAPDRNDLRIQTSRCRSLAHDRCSRAIRSRGRRLA